MILKLKECSSSGTPEAGEAKRGERLFIHW